MNEWTNEWTNEQINEWWWGFFGDFLQVIIESFIQHLVQKPLFIQEWNATVFMSELLDYYLKKLLKHCSKTLNHSGTKHH